MNRREMLEKIVGGATLLSLVASSKVAFGQSGCTKQHYTYPNTSYFRSDCTQQCIQVNGIYRIDVTTCTNSDGTVTTTTHLQAHGTGVPFDPTTGLPIPNGVEYVFNGVQQDYASTLPCGGTETQQFHYELISKGNAPNEQVTGTIIFSTDQNCNPQPPLIKVDSDCHG